MNGKLAACALAIIILAFLGFSFVAVWTSRAAHESSHALVLMSVGVPFDFVVNPFAESHARPLAPVASDVYSVFNLVGKVGAAVVMGVLFLSVTRLEKKSKNPKIILAVIVGQIVFLYYTLEQIGNAVWEGLLTASYHNQSATTGLMWAAFGVTCWALSATLITKFKFSTIKNVITSDKRTISSLSSQ